MVTSDELRMRLATAAATTGDDGMAGRSRARTARLLRLRAHAAVDEVAHRLGTWLHPMNRMDLDRVSAETDRALELFFRQGWLADPAAYHDEPPVLHDPAIETHRRRGRVFEEAIFPSAFDIHLEEPGRDRWFGASYRRNVLAYTRLFRHDDPGRPWVVCVHGTGMGWSGTDFAAFGVDRLHRDLGLNVAIPVLPLSGPRRPEGRFQIWFPTNDHLDNVHALAQSVWDLRRLISWIRSTGGERVATYGVSLGGYVVALHAAYEDDLAAVIAGIPAAEFLKMFEQNIDKDLIRDHPTLLERGRALHRVVAPLEITPRVPVDRRFVYGALSDRLVDPVEQAYALWEHWGQPSLQWYDGGHVGFARSREVEAFVTGALKSTGMLDHAGSSA